MKPIVYISDEELETFVNSSDSMIVGKAYEWEGEKVVHLHTKPIPHSFGKEHCVSFFKGKATAKTVNSYNVEISFVNGSQKIKSYYIDINGIE